MRGANMLGGALFGRGLFGMRLTAVWFLFLQIVFGRVFSSFAVDFDPASQIWMLVFGSAAWIVTFFLSEWACRHYKAACTLTSVLLVLCFFVQSIFVELQKTVVAPGLLYALVVATSCLFTFGYALFAILWLEVLNRKKSSEIPLLICLGCVIGIVVSDVPIVCFGALPGGSLACSVIRMVLVCCSLLCLRRELALLPGTNIEHNALKEGEVLSRSENRRRFVAPISLLFIVVNIVLEASYPRNDEISSDGALLLPFAALVAVALVVVLNGRLARAGVRSGVLYDAIALISSVLYLVYVSVTGGLVDSLWIVVYIANTLIDVALFGIFADSDLWRGGSAAKPFCATFAVQEVVCLIVHLGAESVGQDVLNVASLVLLVVSIAASCFSMFGAFAREGLFSQGGPADEARAFADSVAEEYACTGREREMLFYILQGTSYVRIAERLGVSESTVKTHASHVYRKLGVENRDQLIDRFYQTRV